MENVYYINLNHRKDRKKYIEGHLKQLNWKYNRFNAVQLKNGAIGCSMSHLKILQNAKAEDLEYVVIVEDDFKCINIREMNKKLTKIMSENNNFDVLLLGGNIIPPYKVVNNDAVQVNHSQTTIGYMVKKHYYDILISNIKEGIELLMKNPTEKIKYAIDKYWIQLQKRDKWYIVFPLMVTQLDGYSDIEGKVTNYDHLMLDHEKKWFFERQKMYMNMV